jgi:hypothetical protein
VQRKLPIIKGFFHYELIVNQFTVNEWPAESVNAEEEEEEAIALV